MSLGRLARLGADADHPPVPDLVPVAASATRILTLLWAAGGLTSLAVILLPHPRQANVAGFVVVGVAAFSVAALLRAAEQRLPAWALPLFVALGTMLITSDLWFAGDDRGAPKPDNEMLYLWVALYSAYFFRLRPALVQVGWAIVCYAITLAFIADPHIISTRLIETGGTLVVAVMLIHVLKRRVRELLGQLADTARTDPVTGLHNRRGFEEAIAIEIERARRGGHALTLLIADLDHFKRVNDRLGHAAGDRALARVGHILNIGKRQIDYAARAGGEEFALILPDTTEREAYVVAERLRVAVEAEFAEELVPLTFSFGIAAHLHHGASAETLLSAADRALYAAKELGRNRSVIYSDEIAAISPAGADARAREVHVQTLLSLAEALDTRDAGTADHSQTVGRYCELIARELGLTPGSIERVRLAGVLHDIGKIGLPDSLLRKPGPLDEREWGEMRRHPEIGARILGSTEFDDVRGWVLAHHERPDGGGYPAGLRGDDIPLEARILAVADAYEAMTSDRAYRRALGRDVALGELRHHAGTQFDPPVVEAFLRVAERAARWHGDAAERPGGDAAEHRNGDAAERDGEGGRVAGAIG
jgi:diguanylate cyclase (GGDEF)-like protein